PRPILIMVSGHTQRGTDATLKALSAGAVDFVSKSSSFAAQDVGHIDSELSEKLRYWASPAAALPRSPAPRHASSPSIASADVTQPVEPSLRPRLPRARVDLVVVAASTGGPQTLADFLRNSKPLGAPMVIAQHMPAQFTAS